MRCYATLRDLPEVPDHVGVMVPVSRIFDVLDECAALHVPFVTIFSSGFAETGAAEGLTLQKRLTSFAAETGVRIMGPNCNGLVNFVDGFAFTSSGTVAGGRRKAGTVGLVAQSGGAAQVNVMWRAQQMGLELSYEISCGNSADLDILDFMDFLVEDPHTDVIMVIAEVLRSGARLFEIAARARSKQKPIVILKLGRTEAGSRAAASHTGALTGSDAVHDAAFGQCGIVRVDDCNELYEAAMLLRTKRWPGGTALAALSASGGNAVLLADLGARLGIAWPSYSAETQQALRALLPQHGQAGNPTDVTSAVIGKRDTYRKCIEAIAADPNVDAFIPVLTMAAESDIDQVAQAVRDATKPAAILWTGGCGDNPGLRADALVAQGIPVYRDALSCLKAMRAAMTYGEYLRRSEIDGTHAGMRSAQFQTTDVQRLLVNAPSVVGERLGKQILAAYGLPITREYLAADAESAVACATRFGAPVAMKIESAQIMHKTEAKGVRLGVVGDAAVRLAFADIVEAARSYMPEAIIDGILVQEMAPPGGLEMIVGIAPDPTFGPVLMAGLGGIHVEILKDVVFRIGPVSPEESLAMLRELRGFPLLEGVRGHPPRDIAALCQAISGLSWLARDFADDIREIDINPISVFEEGKGILVLDALITRNTPVGALS